MSFFATIEKPRWFAEFLIKCFIYFTNIKLDDAVYQNISDYPNVQKLFTRKLRKNARLVDNYSLIVNLIV